MKHLLKLTLALAVISTTMACGTSKAIGDKSLLTGNWITITPENSPNVIIRKDNKLLVLMTEEDKEEVVDTLRFNYTLKGEKLALYMDNKLVSRSKLLKLTTDSLSYLREKDKEIFTYKRKAK